MTSSTSPIIVGYQDFPVYAYAQVYEHGTIEHWHSHNRSQLIHALSGVIHVKTTMGTWVTPAHRGVWIPAGCAHSLQMFGQVDSCSLFVLPLARADLSNQCQIVSISPLLRELIRAALHIQSAIEPHSRAERILELILDELRFLPSEPLNLPEPKSLALQNLCQSIQQDLSKNWTLEQAAKTMHVSSKTLSRYFGQELNMNFSDWLRQAKLLHALSLLSMGHSVLHVALELGYDSPSAFTAMFKRLLGASPRDYFSQADTVSDSRR